MEYLCMLCGGERAERKYNGIIECDDCGWSADELDIDVIDTSSKDDFEDFIF